MSTSYESVRGLQVLANDLLLLPALIAKSTSFMQEGLYSSAEHRKPTEVLNKLIADERRPIVHELASWRLVLGTLSPVP
jgi:hypothetical protein